MDKLNKLDASEKNGPFYGPIALDQMEKERREKLFGLDSEPQPDKLSYILSIINLILSFGSIILCLQWWSDTHRTIEKNDEPHIYGNDTNLTSLQYSKDQYRIHMILYTILFGIILPSIVNVGTTLPTWDGLISALRFIGVTIIIVADQFPNHGNTYHGILATPTRILLVITIILWIASTIGVFTSKVYSLRFIGALLTEDSKFRTITLSLLSLIFLSTSITGIYETRRMSIKYKEVFKDQKHAVEGTLITWILLVSIVIIQIYHKHELDEHTRCISKRQFIQHFVNFQHLKDKSRMTEEDLILKNKEGLPRVNVPMRKL